VDKIGCDLHLNQIYPMKLLLLTVLVACASAGFIRNHDFWYTAGKTLATSGIPFGDIAWGYCDMKCTYLEKYYPGMDFVVIPFSESTIKPDFAACYVAVLNAGVTSYKLWDTVASNTYYEANCGSGDANKKEEEDYYALSQGANPKYKVNGDILGVGIGTEINY
jgi:hypothetical protein